MAYDILIVDDQEDIRQLLSDILQEEGYTTRKAASGQEALEQIKARAPHLVLLDVWLKEAQFDGLHVLDLLKQTHPHLPIIMLSGHSSIETAINALKVGAYDFIEKPFKTDRLLNLIDRALDHMNVMRELESLKSSQDQVLEYVGDVESKDKINHFVDSVAKGKSRVLITGAQGCGKKLVAHLIHHRSARRLQACLTVKCSLLNGDHFEKEFYGEEGEGNPSAGAAVPFVRAGLLEKAQGGTLVLDGIDQATPLVQEKILRMIQDPVFQRVRGRRSLEYDVRFIFTAKREIEDLVSRGDFSSDLFYRINVMRLKLLPLSLRPRDVLPLFHFFRGPAAFSVDAEAQLALESYSWPGNVRQLKNVVEWIRIMHASEEIISTKMLPMEIQENRGAAPDKFIDKNYLLALTLKEAREEFERAYLRLHIRRFDGNISKTAHSVGMERTALHRKIKSLNLGSEEVVEFETACGG